MDMGGNGKLWATVALLGALLIGAIRMGAAPDALLMGGRLHTAPVMAAAGEVPAFLPQAEEWRERFLRPSQERAMPLHYDGGALLAVYEAGGTVPYARPEDVAHGYFALLGLASNLEGYSGGCGTVGYGVTPYPYAWGLFTDEARKEMSLDDFMDSFAGVGAFTPLKLIPLAGNDQEQSYYVEVEYIQTGRQSTKPQPTYFAYCYGLMTVRHTGDGWRIASVDYLPEDFLCAPYHGWDWDAESFVSIVYGDWYGLVEQIDRVDRQDGIITVFASGVGHEYRFQFVRMANGTDRLIGEQQLDSAGHWREASLLKEDARAYKLTPGSPIFVQ